MAWPAVAAIAASAAAGYLGSKGKGGGGDATIVPAVLDIDDAAARVYQESTSERAPYSGFLPYMFGTGGAGRYPGIPAYSPQYIGQMRQLAAGNQAGPTMAGIITGQGRMPASANPYAAGFGIGFPFAGPGAPQGGYLPGQGYTNPYAYPPPGMQPGVAQPPVPEEEPISQEDEEEPVLWRMGTDPDLGVGMVEVWDDRRKQWVQNARIDPRGLDPAGYVG